MIENNFVINLLIFCNHSSAPFHSFINSPNLIPFPFSVCFQLTHISPEQKVEVNTNNVNAARIDHVTHVLDTSKQIASIERRIYYLNLHLH